MSDDSDDFARAVRHDCLSGFYERAAGVCHIINEDGDSVLHVADKHHARDFVGAGTLFVDEGEAEVEAVGDRGCSVRRVELASLLLSWESSSPFTRRIRCSWLCMGMKKKGGEGDSGQKENDIKQRTYLFAPPASGLTTTHCLTSKFALIHRSVLGSAYRLSTGTLKKPCI